MENELLIFENDGFEYPELELEMFVAENALTGSVSNIEEENMSGEEISGTAEYVDPDGDW